MLIKIVDMGIETRLGKRTENLEPGGHSSQPAPVQLVQP